VWCTSCESDGGGAVRLMRRTSCEGGGLEGQQNLSYTSQDCFFMSSERLLNMNCSTEPKLASIRQQLGSN
jgi:hypothetical protein